jgi:hypothetical protein
MTSNRRISGLIIAGVASVALYVGLPKGVAISADLSLAEIIENVSANELLYAELDAQLSEDYQHLNSAKTALSNDFVPTLTSSHSVHYVRQNGMFRLECSGKSVDGDNSSRALTRTRLFDGEETKLLETSAPGKSGRANLISGIAEDECTVRPHMLLLRMTRAVVPLSIYAQGTDAIKAYPYGEVPENIDVQVAYKGSAVHRDLTCHVLWITNVLKATGDPHDRWVLWLAEDRNYIPVKLEAYTFRFSSEIPVGEGEVLEWMELDEGVWFPKSANVRAYDKRRIQSDKEKEVLWKRDYRIENANLTPDYPQSYFSNLDIPDGSAVYRIVNKHITESYREGQPLANSKGTRGASWAFWLNVVVIFTIFATIALRRRNRVLG